MFADPSYRLAASQCSEGNARWQLHCARPSDRRHPPPWLSARRWSPTACLPQVVELMEVQPGFSFNVSLGGGKFVDVKQIVLDHNVKFPDCVSPSSLFVGYKRGAV